MRSTTDVTGGWRFRRMRLLALAASVSGCYVYTPAGAAPSAGSTLSFTLNDAGRVALGRSIGANAGSLEGEVETTTDSSYVIHVQSVTYIGGQYNKWSGERLEIGRSLIATVKERTLSKSRTALVVAVGVGGAVAFIATRGLNGGGGETTPPPGPPPVGQ